MTTLKVQKSVKQTSPSLHYKSLMTSLNYKPSNVLLSPGRLSRRMGSGAKKKLSPTKMMAKKKLSTSKSSTILSPSKKIKVKALSSSPSKLQKRQPPTTETISSKTNSKSPSSSKKTKADGEISWELPPAIVDEILSPPPPQLLSQSVRTCDDEEQPSKPISPAKELIMKMSSPEGGSSLRPNQELHLVLDLDATLVSTKEDMRRFGRCEEILASISDPVAKRDLESRIIQFSCGGQKMWTILRPLAVEFIEFACCYFKRISIWSAGQKDYVDSIIQLLFPSHIPRPTVVFTWDDCIQHSVEGDKVIKNDKVPPSDSSPPNPSLGMSASPSNHSTAPFSKPIANIAKLVGDDVCHMLILDDRKDIATQNVNNLIHIPPFDPRLTKASLTKEDLCLDQFIAWLMRDDVMQATDIRTVPKSNIFEISSNKN